MKKQILLAATTITLVMTGCAQKKLNTIDNVAGTPDTNMGTTNMGTSNGIIYENVDPIGQGMSQGNGTYGQANGGYGQAGTIYSNENGTYGDAGVQNIYFNVNQYNITSEKLGEISHNAKLLRSSGTVKVEGHCDASGSDEYNYALGLRRAKATKDALVSNGMPAKNVSLVSMGESSPECTTSSSSDCYAKNRRVEFKVMQ